MRRSTRSPQLPIPPHMRPFRPVLLVLVALLAMAFAPAVAGAAKPGKTPSGKAKAKGKKPKKQTGPMKVTKIKNVRVGIAEQKPNVFTDPLFKPLGIRYARRSVGWDTMKYDWQIADVDAWLTAARSAGVTPMISFAKSREASRRRYLPSVAEYRAQFAAFRKRWPWVREYAATNESNHPAEMGGTNPKRAMQYWRAMKAECPSCKVAAATLLDFPSNRLIPWTKAFLKAAGKKKPTLWALHNYVSANRFDEKLIRQLLKVIKGEVWITEVGGLVYRKPAVGRVKLTESIPHQTKVTEYVFTRMLKLSPRIKRVYVFHWDAGGSDASWDSGLVDNQGNPRPALSIVQKALGLKPTGALPVAKPNTPTPVGPPDAVLP